MRFPAKILVVDDEAIVCRSCQAILVEDGHDVLVAFTAEEALRTVESSDIDVALVDLRIPGSGRFDILRAIRKTSPRTDVVVITGYPSIDNAKEAIRLGAFEYLTKPFAPETVRNIVSYALVCRPWSMGRRR